MANQVDLGASGEPPETAIQQALFTYGRLEKRLERQLAQIEQLDGKLGTLLGFGGAMITLFGAAILFVYTYTGSLGFVTAALAAVICIAGVLFVAFFAVVVYAYAFYSVWDDAPVLDEMERRGAPGEMAGLIDAASIAVQRALDLNASPLAAKRTLTTIALILAGATGVSVAVAAMAAVIVAVA